MKCFQHCSNNNFCQQIVQDSLSDEAKAVVVTLELNLCELSLHIDLALRGVVLSNVPYQVLYVCSIHLLEVVKLLE